MGLIVLLCCWQSSNLNFDFNVIVLKLQCTCICGTVFSMFDSVFNLVHFYLTSLKLVLSC